jgi:hypothetical protein
MFPILLDTCSYLRLARSIHPLLSVEFGNEGYCLYLIEDFQDEFSKNPRLKTSFSWVTQKEYVENRANPLLLSKDNRQNVELTLEMVRYKAQINGFGTSYIDCKAISIAEVLNIPLVTDDADILDVCEEFEVKTFKSLEILKFMVDCDYIDMEQVKSIVAYWQYENDLPKNFLQDYQEIFGEEPPDDF